LTSEIVGNHQKCPFLYLRNYGLSAVSARAGMPRKLLF